MICEKCSYYHGWATEKGKERQCDILGAIKEENKDYCCIFRKKSDKKKR